MRKTAYFSVMYYCLLLFAGTAFGQEVFHMRGGLPNLAIKAKTERHLHIGYLGGSITEAVNGWRDLTYNWFRLNFPQTVITQNNGGIGGTGSDLGVFRVESDILSKSPDLVFVEFAVNDGGKSQEVVQRDMEGIVRKIWTESPTTDICFVYTVDEPKCNKLLEGKLDSTVVYMEEIANYYGIPSIHMGIEVSRLLKSGKLVFTDDPKENEHRIVFTKDHVHPLAESGHPIYAAQVAKYMPSLMKSPKKAPHILPVAFRTDNWYGAHKKSIAGLSKDGFWEQLPPDNILMKSFSGFLPEIYKGVPGSKIRFSFTGTALGLLDVVGPTACILKVTVDGRQKEISRFDKYCSYNRIAYIILFDNLENRQHDVQIEVSDKPVNKAGVLNSESLVVYKENPDLFRKNEYYIGAVLLN